MKIFTSDTDMLPCITIHDGCVVPVCGSFERYAQNELLQYAPAEGGGAPEDLSQALEHIVARFVDAGFCPYMNQVKLDESVITKRPDKSTYGYGQCNQLAIHEVARNN